jgi:hypothetical protein
LVHVQTPHYTTNPLASLHSARGNCQRDVLLLLLATVAIDVAALMWGSDSRRLDPQSYMPS